MSSEEDDNSDASSSDEEENASNSDNENSDDSDNSEESDDSDSEDSDDDDDAPKQEPLPPLPKFERRKRAPPIKVPTIPIFQAVLPITFIQRATERASLIVTFFAPPKVKVQQRQYVRQDVAAIPKKTDVQKTSSKDGISKNFNPLVISKARLLKSKIAAIEMIAILKTILNHII